MNRIRVVAVLCVLAAVAGGSTVLSFSGHSQYAPETAKQTASPPDLDSTEGITVQMVPKETRIQRGHTAVFAVRIGEVAEHSDGVLLGLRTNLDDPEYSFESKHPETQVIHLSFFEKFDTVLYVPTNDAGGPIHVPVLLSGEEKLPPGNYTVTATVLPNGIQEVGTTELGVEVLCPIECRAILGVQGAVDWVRQNLGLIIGTLSLLIAFFGREKIWSFIRALNKHISGTSNNAREKDETQMREE